MTVLSGRASSGARSLLRVLVGGLFAAFGLLAGGCGSNTIYYGTVVTTFSSDPGPFAAYIVDLYSFYLVLNNGTTNYGFTGSVGTGKTIDFAQLADTTELFGPVAVPEGTYTSATITFNYATNTSNVFAAQLFLDLGGNSIAATLVDPTTTTTPQSPPGTITYTVRFDPYHPLVVNRGTPTALDFHFDENASSVITTTAPTATAGATATVAVRPFMTVSTQPVITKPLRARGEFVIADTVNSNFTMNIRSFFDPPSYTQTAQGAVLVQTTDQTTYNVNGLTYQGATGLAAVAALPQITTIQANGALTGAISSQKPILTATEVYAGIAVENNAATGATGTVVSRSGDTLTLRNAELIHPPGYLSSTSNVIEFIDPLKLTINDSSTVVTVDQHPSVSSSTQLISIGQKVNLQAVAAYATPGTLDATGGLIRLTSTPAWGTLTSATPGSATVNLLNLGNTYPAGLTFTGTGATSASDANPASYVIGTGTVDLSAYAAGASLFRFDGIVSPYGTAAPSAGTPDFTASAVSAGTSSAQNFATRAEQVLVIEWSGTAGTTSPFTLSTTTELVPNMTSLGATHVVQSGPTSIDLTNPAVTPTIVPDPTLTGQFSLGNGSTGTTTGISVFNSMAAFVTILNEAINGTNTFQKLVAVGKYDPTTATFTAYRIDIVQLP